VFVILSFPQFWGVAWKSLFSGLPFPGGWFSAVPFTTRLGIRTVGNGTVDNGIVGKVARVMRRFWRGLQTNCVRLQNAAW
jgi:hypothetical protein